MLSVEEAEVLNNYFTPDQSIEFMDILMDTLDKYRLSSNSISYFEVALLKMVHHLQRSSNHANNLVSNVEVIKSVKEAESIVIGEVKTNQSIEKEEVILEAETHQDNEFISNNNEPIDEFIEEISDESIEDLNEDLDIQEEENTSKAKAKPNETDVMDNLFDVQSNQNEKSTSTTDLLLGLMQTADKEIRVNDEKIWKMKPYLHHLEFAKIARLLQSSSIKLSSTTFIVVVVDVEEEKHMISDPQLETLIKEFTLEIFKVSKKLICVTKFEWSVALATFMEIRDKQGQLPPPVHVTLEEVNVLDDDQKLQLKLKEVVGHHVEIVIED